MRATGSVVPWLASLTVLVGGSASAARAPRALSVPPAPLALRVMVDASEAPRGIFHARLEIPAAPGPLTLLYPKWLPGEHGPTGPVVNVAGLKFRSRDRDLAWTRDPRDMYAVRCTVPDGAQAVTVDLDFLSPSEGSGFSFGGSTTEQLAIVSWNQLLLYPEGRSGADIVVEPSLRVPTGWGFGTSLGVRDRRDDAIVFEPATMTTVIDAPVLIGRHMREIVLQDDPRHVLHVAADGEAALALPADLEAAYRKLVKEATALFGGRPYREYHFLLALSDHVAQFGLEHHESSDNRVPERTWIDDDEKRLQQELLPHEFVHSWNGKFRRPAELTRDDFNEPIDSSLLWVYEGLTQYLGQVLTARSGIETADEFREDLARIAAELDATRGRTWRPLVDTAVAAQLLYGAADGGSAWRRSVDFYDESALIWLEADVIIRRGSGARRSLDDFVRAFFGGGRGRAEVVPYTYDDVLTALNEVHPFDWDAFFEARVRATSDHPPLAGIEGGGYRLVFNETMPPALASRKEVEHRLDLGWSLGVILDPDTGTVRDVIPDSPSAAAGLAPQMVVVAVDAKRFTEETMREALALGRSSGAPMQVLVRNGEFFRTFAVDYHGGERYPHLERDPAVPDLLSEIAAPRSR